MSALTVCQCCLSADLKIVLSAECSELLENIIGSELHAEVAGVQICFLCYCLIKKVSKFRSVCLSAAVVLEQYRAREKYSDGLEFLERERQRLSIGTQPSLSSTLFVDIPPSETGGNSVLVVTYSHGAELRKNISKVCDAKDDIKVEIEDEKSTDHHSLYSICNDDHHDMDVVDIFEDIILGKVGSEDLGDQAIELLSVAENIWTAEADNDPNEKARKTKCRTKVGNLKKPKRVINHTLNDEISLETGIIGTNEVLEINHTSARATKPLQKRCICSECGKSFTRPCFLRTHMWVHNGKKKYACEVCDRTFAASSQLKRHKLDHTGERPFTCEECGKTFKQASTLKGHQRRHLTEKPFSCDGCPSTFFLENNLRIHRRLHTGERPYSCDKCGKSFIDKCYLKQHVKIHTDQIAYTCDVCGLSYAQLSKLNYHKLSHREERPFSCEECGKTFKLIGQLNSHKGTHAREKPFTCDVCGHSFRLVSNLKAHKRVHTGERPYHCNVCGKSYTEAGYLKKHKRIHTGEKPFSCDVCGKSFVETCTLRRHRRVHTGEQPFSCDECGMHFKQSGGLKKHKKKHANEKLPGIGAAKWKAVQIP